MNLLINEYGKGDPKDIYDLFYNLKPCQPKNTRSLIFSVPYLDFVFDQMFKVLKKQRWCYTKGLENKNTF